MQNALRIQQYPVFDLLELTSEPEISFKRYKAVKPVTTGEAVPDFSLSREHDRWQQYFNGAEIHGPATISQLLSKPLVVSFYSAQWKNYGLEVLKHLNRLQHEIKACGGNLLIICAEKDEQLPKLAWENSFSLSFYFDEDNSIAKKFRVFNDDDPIWNKFSGIDVNVPLLATYVVSAVGKVVFDYVENDFTGEFPAKPVLSSVYQAGILRKVPSLKIYN
jgi:peroxiredoxin